jgi:alpha-D-xyloside xylohydrolase
MIQNRNAAKQLIHFLILTLLVPFSSSFSQDNSETFQIGKFKLGISFYSPSIVRVRITPTSSFGTRTSLSVLAQPRHFSIKKTLNKSSVRLHSQALTTDISLVNGSILFQDKSGRIILATKGITPNSFITDTIAGESAYHIKQEFSLSPDEGVFGLGQFEDAVMNYRGHDILISQANRTAVNPFLISTKGYGILWDNYSKSRFSDSPATTYFWSEVADEIDYYFCYGPSMDSVITQYRLLTGAAPLFGKWAYGYWQSKERYVNAQEVLDVLHEYRSRKIPLDNLVQDWNYWPSPGQFSGMIWDSTRFPSPKSLVDSVHQSNAHIIASIWPAFGNQSEIYKEMKSKGFLYPVPHWNEGLVYDAFDPDARALYWKYLKKGLFEAGFDGYWTDATEPEFRCTDDRYITELSMKEAGRNALGTFARYLNPFSLMTTKGIYEHHRQATDEKRVFLLTRSAFAGQQRNAAVTWSGDTFASWDNLKVQIASGINFSMSGIPYWNSDIGGFITNFHFPRGFEDPAYKELYVRWFQFGALSPIFRAHGTNIPREIWRIGSDSDPATKALIQADLLRYRLMPYIYSTAWQVTKNGYSFLRCMAMSYPDDARTYGIADQYFFGKSLLVRPVTRSFQSEPEFSGIDITPKHFRSSDGSEHGADLSFYRGLSFDQLVMRRKIDVGQIAWFGCVPLELDTAYSLRISGQLTADTPGRHTFFIKTDGGVRMWICDSLLIDAWDNNEEKILSSTYALASNQGNSFRVEHRQFKSKSANFKINWKEPNAPSISDTTLPVYLPQGAPWCDFWTGQSIVGGQTIQVAPPLNQIPIFVPAGSIIPFGPMIQYANQRTEEPIEVRIYPGKNAEFMLYDDEGDSYRYEQGLNALIPIHWNDKERTLTFGTQVGTFPGAPCQRIFHLVIVSPGHGIGLEDCKIPEKIVTYKRKELKVHLK